tara:strand:+ start:12874 stop:14529 length:1656 start_codon:yes stop_codon:yes gene_type:complete
MAFGKADLGLIKADAARYGASEGVARSAAAGQFAKQMIGMDMQQKKAQADSIQKINDDFNKRVDLSLGEGEKGYTAQVKGFLRDIYTTGKAIFAGSDKINQEQIVKIVNDGATAAKQFSANTHMTVENGNMLGPGYDQTDEYFVKAGVNSPVVSVDGVPMRKIKAPEGYPSKDGFVYFNVKNDPIGMDKWSAGSGEVMNAWNTNIVGTQGKPVAFEKAGTSATAISSNLKTKLKGANFWQAQDLINQDHSEDGVDNPFSKQFTSGALPSEYYEDINSTDDNKSYISVYRKAGKARDADKDGIPLGVDAEGETGEQGPVNEGNFVKVTYDPSKGPLGGLTEKELSGYLKGTLQDGSRDYRNETRINDFIVDKYSKYHGEVTADFYKKRQAEEMKKANRYFVMPGQKTPFMGGEINFPTAATIQTQRETAFKDQLFEGFAQDIGTQIDAKAVDMSTNLGTSEGEMFKSLQEQYGKYDDIDMKAKDGVLTVQVGDNAAQSFDTKNMDNKKLQQLKSYLNRSNFDNFSLLDGLGNDANTWNLTAPSYAISYKKQN